MLLWLLALALVSGLCPAQEHLSPAMQAQRASIEKQRAAIAVQGKPPSLDRQVESVRKQVLRAAPQAAPGFFTIPWPDPPKLPQADVTWAFPCQALAARDLFSVTGRAAQRTGIAQEILQAVIHQESAGRPCAVSPKGALGLMQLMPGTAGELGVSDALDPQENVTAGSLFLRNLLERYSGDLTLALAAYNAGPSRVDRAGGIPEIPETQNYVRSVLERIRSPKPPE